MTLPAPLHPPRRLLMGPGPTEVPDSVLRALSMPTLGHLDPAFTPILDELSTMMRDVWGTQNPCTLALSATGSAGMEACFSNLIEPGERALIGVNGVFGQRMVELAKRAGADVTVVNSQWGHALNPADFRLAAKGRRFKVLALVHAETSTGVRNDLGAFRSVANEYGALLVADCVTSLAAGPLNIDKLGVDAAYSGSQKCLSGPPGLSPITVSKRAYNLISARKTPCQSWYLDLALLSSYWFEPRSYHHTAPSNLLYGLHEALRLTLQEGLPARAARLSLHAGALWAGLAAMGLNMPVSSSIRLPQLTLVAIPDKVNDLAVRGTLLNEYGIEIGGGLGVFAGKAWRVGLMGDAASQTNVLRLVAALSEALRRQGYTQAHAGVAAVSEYYSQSRDAAAQDPRET